MAVLLFAEHDNAELNAATHKAMTAASQLGGDVHVLVAGQGCRAVADQAAKLSGAAKVILVEADHLQHGLAEEMTGLIVPMMDNYDALVAAATNNGKNVLPRVAAMLDVAQVSEITEVKSADTFVRLIYAGNAVQELSLIHI